MEIDNTKLAAVLALSRDERYQHFIKIVADWEVLWAVFNSNVPATLTIEGRKVCPLWPAKQYADLYSENHFTGYEARPVELESFMNELLPQLRKDGVLLDIFPTLNDEGAAVATTQLVSDMRKELENYE